MWLHTLGRPGGQLGCRQAPSHQPAGQAQPHQRAPQSASARLPLEEQLTPAPLLQGCPTAAVMCCLKPASVLTRLPSTATLQSLPCAGGAGTWCLCQNELQCRCNPNCPPAVLSCCKEAALETCPRGLMQLQMVAQAAKLMAILTRPLAGGLSALLGNVQVPQLPQLGLQMAD